MAGQRLNTKTSIYHQDIVTPELQPKVLKYIGIELSFFL